MPLLAPPTRVQAPPFGSTTHKHDAHAGAMSHNPAHETTCQGGQAWACTPPHPPSPCLQAHSQAHELLSDCDPCHPLALAHPCVRHMCTHTMCHAVSGLGNSTTPRAKRYAHGTTWIEAGGNMAPQLKSVMHAVRSTKNCNATTKRALK